MLGSAQTVTPSKQGSTTFVNPNDAGSVAIAIVRLKMSSSKIDNPLRPASPAESAALNAGPNAPK